MAEAAPNGAGNGTGGCPGLQGKGCCRRWAGGFGVRVRVAGTGPHGRCIFQGTQGLRAESRGLSASSMDLSSHSSLLSSN